MANVPGTTELSDGWRFIGADEIDVSGRMLSQSAVAAGVLVPRMPATSLKARRDAGLYADDPYVGDHLTRIDQELWKRDWYSPDLLFESNAPDRVRPEPDTANRQFRIILSNTSDHLAFFTRIQMCRPDTAAEILPSHHSDNFVTVYPHEPLEVTAHFERQVLPAGDPTLAVTQVNGVRAGAPDSHTAAIAP
ncbi:hypothetical protein [Gordonia sp. NPDC003950]